MLIYWAKFILMEYLTNLYPFIISVYHLFIIELWKTELSIVLKIDSPGCSHVGHDVKLNK